MINILKCNSVDLTTLIEINTNQINKLKSGYNIPPFIYGEIKKMQKENEQLKALINHLNNK